MEYTDVKSCLTCAWRETCKKRFSTIEDIGLKCPEYTYDVTLDKKLKEHQNAAVENKNKL
ncbi:MAG: hypothetical protein M1381_11540 [Deltaproteobacteria bacterium]|nr:hypothetical protein [Deltaproteobacteria bacterium]MCL5878393.1 hypothetical protein [Deltaproteobacteria bacterium]